MKKFFLLYLVLAVIFIIDCALIGWQVTEIYSELDRKVLESREIVKTEILIELTTWVSNKPDSTMNYLDWLYLSQAKEIARLKKEVANMKKK